MAGDDRHGSSQGPRRLLEAGAEKVLGASGTAVTVENVNRSGPFRDTASSSAAVNRQLAAAVQRAVSGPQLPVIIAGSCVASHGALAGFNHARCGAVWLDAHADFNTPDSTTSGYFPGMSLAVITGHCFGDYWAQIGDSTPLAEEQIVMLGVRSLSPKSERDRLDKSAIEVVPWVNGTPEGDVQKALDRLRRRVDDVYLHVDMDAFDPGVAPGVVDEPVPGGLSLGDAERIIRATGTAFRIRAVTLATFNPENDRDDRTLRAALRILELVGEWASAADPG